MGQCGSCRTFSVMEKPGPDELRQWAEEEGTETAVGPKRKPAACAVPHVAGAGV